MIDTKEFALNVALRVPRFSSYTTTVTLLVVEYNLERSIQRIRRYGHYLLARALASYQNRWNIGKPTPLVRILSFSSVTWNFAAPIIPA